MLLFYPSVKVVAACVPALEPKRDEFKKFPPRSPLSVRAKAEREFFVINNKGDWLGLWCYLSRKVAKET